MGRRTGVSALRNPGGAQLDVHEEGDVGLCISCLPTRVPPKLALALADSSYAWGSSLSCNCANGGWLLKPASAAGQQVQPSHNGQDAYYRGHRDYPEEHS